MRVDTMRTRAARGFEKRYATSWPGYERPLWQLYVLSSVVPVDVSPFTVPDVQSSVRGVAAGHASAQVPAEHVPIVHVLRVDSTRQPAASGAHVTAALPSQYVADGHVVTREHGSMQLAVPDASSQTMPIAPQSTPMSTKQPSASASHTARWVASAQLREALVPHEVWPAQGSLGERHTGIVPVVSHTPPGVVVQSVDVCTRQPIASIAHTTSVSLLQSRPSVVQRSAGGT